MIKALILLSLLGCTQTAVNKQSDKLKLTIFHTNDHHGHYLQDEKGQYGMSARSTLLKGLRAELKSRGEDSLLLSGGDINTGTMESDLFDAEPDFKGMRKLGYDAMAVGNHEFDNSYEVIKQQMKWAGFPFLSANVYFKNTEERVFKPSYIVKKIKGYRIGIFGLTTFDTPAVASHEDASKKITFKPVIPEARKVVADMRSSANVDFIIAVTHVGHNGSPTARGDIDLAKNVNGIDVIIGGHSQELINAEVHNDTIIVQAKDWGKYLGKLELDISKKGKEVRNYELIPINLQKSGKLVGVKIEEDPDFINLFTPFKNEADKLGQRTLTILDKTLDASRGSVRTAQMPVAQFVGAAMREQVPQIEIGVINGGSLRNSLSAGAINRKELHKLHPYGNTIIRVEMTAKELFRYMESMSDLIFKSQASPLGGYPQLVNMKIKIKGKALVEISGTNGKWWIKKQDEKITSNKKTFVFGTLNFLARGGDNYPVLKNYKGYVDTGFMINTALMNYSEKRSGGLYSRDYEKMNLNSVRITK